MDSSHSRRREVRRADGLAKSGAAVRSFLSRTAEPALSSQLSPTASPPLLTPHPCPPSPLSNLSPALTFPSSSTRSRSSPPLSTLSAVVGVSALSPARQL